jgi:exonuclease 1
LFSLKVNVSQLAGKTVAIDAYVWLHRGAFSCAEKLARGQITTGYRLQSFLDRQNNTKMAFGFTCSYVGYGMKMLNMLIANKIKPILVFDGRRLKAKEATEKKRHE